MSLGSAYGGGAAGTQDLVFTYRSNGELKIGTISYTGGAITSAPEPACGVLFAIAAVFTHKARRLRLA